MAELKATNVDGTLTSLRLENVTTSSKSLALADRDRVISCNNTDDITITVPNDSNTNFPIGSVIYVSRDNTGGVDISAESGVTLSLSGSLGPNEEVIIRKKANNSWNVIDQKNFNLDGAGGSVSTAETTKSHSFTSTGTDTFSIQQ